MLTGWMGALQAQDYAMAKWALGVRLPGSTDSDVETALSNGEILRTHLLRPTWHFVSADDIGWLLALTAPQIKTRLKTRHQGLELSEAVFSQSNALVVKALQGGKHLTRADLITEFGKANIATDENRASHLLMWAELEGIICSGPLKKGLPVYSLLEETVPLRRSLPRDEALSLLAGKYFISRGPATLQDFVWWSGLSVSAAKRALEMVKADFASETVAGQTCWFAPTSSAAGPTEAYLLPAFDEFIISYADRSASLPPQNFHKAVSNNGIFRPMLVINGQIAGLWKRTIKKDVVSVETEFFEQTDPVSASLVENACLPFGAFLGKHPQTK